jgi:antirestriction protein ArdC
MATSTAHPAAATENQPQKRDFRQEVTDRIVKMLEEGVAPWQKPWEPGASSAGMPMNPTTDKAYRGGNAIHLMATALSRGYDDPRWMTYKQAADNGWQVRRGEKGTQIEFWEVKPVRDKDRSGQPEGVPAGEATDRNRDRDGSRLIHRVYTVFNARQIEGVPAYKPKEHSTFEAIESAEKILDNSGARIAHDQADRAFYSRASDSIHLPPRDAFKDPAGYYGTALHELAHWTGHPSRLNRQTLNETYRFGDTNYAKEELRAELASVFLAAERGIPHDPAQHAAYVGSWISALKQDKNEIFRAAHDASAASDFLLGLERDRSIADQALAATPAKDVPTTGTSRAAVFEERTTKLEQDREDMAEQPGTDVAPAETTPVRESTQFAARYEAGSSTVNVEHKQTGTDHRTTVDPSMNPDRNGRAGAAVPESAKDGTPASPFRAAEAITRDTLGNSAHLREARTDSGTYRGPIIGETESHLIQRQSAHVGIAHLKSALDQQPGIGTNVSINYSDGKALVREVRDRAKTQGLGR